MGEVSVFAPASEGRPDRTEQGSVVRIPFCSLLLQLIIFVLG